MGLCIFFFHLQVVSWVLTSPLAQAPVPVRKPSSHAHSSANTQPCACSHPLRAIKYVTNGKPEPPSGDFARSPPMSVTSRNVCPSPRPRHKSREEREKNAAPETGLISKVRLRRAAFPGAVFAEFLSVFLGWRLNVTRSTLPFRRYLFSPAVFHCAVTAIVCLQLNATQCWEWRSTW